MLNRARTQRQAVEWVVENGGSVRYAFQVDSNKKATPDYMPQVLVNLLGIDFFSTVESATIYTADITPLSQLTGLKELKLDRVLDLSPLESLTQLTELRLQWTGANDLSPMANMTKLTQLSLGANVSDLSPLACLTQLIRLRLWKHNISEAEFDALQKSLPNLSIQR